MTEPLSAAIGLREVANLRLAIFCFNMFCLYVRRIYHDIKEVGYREMNDATKGAIAWAFISGGEFLRSSSVWGLLHYTGERATYLNLVLPSTLSIALVAIGSLCAIRIFSPERWGHWPWVINLIVAGIAATLSLLWH